MGRLVRSTDWSKTPLGPADQWPDELRVAVDICLNSRFPMFVWWGPELINIYNDGYVPMLGKRHPAALGRPARDSWDDIWSVVGPQADAVMTRGEATWNERVRLVMERKGYREDTYFTWSYSPIRDASGRVRGLFCAVTEETERVRAEADRDRLAAQRQLALDAARMGWWHYDPVTRVATYDRRYAEIFGVAGHQRPNEEILKRLHPDDLPQVWAKVEAALDPVDPKPYSAEYRVVLDDGSIKWVEAHGIVTFEGEGPDRRAVSFVGTVVDVTDRRGAEEAVRRHERQLQLITDTAPAYIAYCDRDRRFRFVNRHYAERFGLRPEQVVGRALPDVLGHEAYEAIRPYVEQVLSGRPVEFELEVPYQSLGRRWMQCRYAPEFDERGEVRAWVSVILDVSKRKQVEEALRQAKEEAERANAAKSEFLATLSHELRTPLTPVLLTVSMLEADPTLPESFREDVATIRRNVELESRLISDLLDLTRIERGKLQLDERDVDLHLVVRSAAEICQREAPAKLTLDLRAERSTVRGDATRLQQVFWNLINNAIKFTPRGGNVLVRSFYADDARVRVEVIDSGEGIDAAVMPKLFNAFEQGEVRAARQQAGLGLGLAISRKLAEAHGGTITAASPGRGLGATFSVDLPTVEGLEQSAAEAHPPRVTSPVGVRPLNVLLVEDHEPTLRVLERLLRQIGHRVTGATSVASATAAAAVDGFDLIISDLGLPDGSGLDVMRQARDRFAGRAIALTGYGMESDVAASREAGFTEHLTKPVDLSALRAAIERVAGKADGVAQ